MTPDYITAALLILLALTLPIWLVRRDMRGDER